MLSSPHRRGTASLFAFAAFLTATCSGFQLRTSAVLKTAVGEPLMMFFADELPPIDERKEKSAMEPEIAAELETATLEAVMEVAVKEIKTTTSKDNMDEKKEKTGAEPGMVAELEAATLETETEGVMAKELETVPRVRKTAVGKSSSYGGLQLLSVILIVVVASTTLSDSLPEEASQLVQGFGDGSEALSGVRQALDESSRGLGNSLVDSKEILKNLAVAISRGIEESTSGISSTFGNGQDFIDGLSRALAATTRGVSRTVTSSGSLLQDATGILSRAFDYFSGGLSGGLEMLQGAVVAGDLTKSTRGFSNSLSEGQGALQKAAGSFARTLEESSSGLGGSFARTFEESSSGLGHSLEGALQSAGSRLSRSLGDGEGPLQNAAHSFARTLDESSRGLEGILQSTTSTFSRGLANGQGALQNVAGSLIRTLEESSTGISGNLAQRQDVESLSHMFQDTSREISGNLGTVQSAFISLLDDSTRGLGNTLADGKDILGNIGASVTVALEESARGTGSLMEECAKGFDETTKGASRGIREILNGVGTGIGEGLIRCGEWFVDVGRLIRDTESSRVAG